MFDIIGLSVTKKMKMKIDKVLVIAVSFAKLHWLLILLINGQSPVFFNHFE